VVGADDEEEVRTLEQLSLQVIPAADPVQVNNVISVVIFMLLLTVLLMLNRRKRTTTMTLPDILKEQEKICLHRF
jgi:hypothetical protein